MLEQLQLLIYDEEQVRYLAIGESVAAAFKTGLALKKDIDSK